MGIKKKKISELPLAQSLVGLFTLGVDKFNKSVKVGLEFVKTAADNATAATISANNAASSATTAATSANKAASSANAAASGANTAKNAANTAAGLATNAAEDANTAAMYIDAKIGLKLDNILPMADHGVIANLVYGKEKDGEPMLFDVYGMFPEDVFAYGIEWDTTVPSPLCTRVGNMAFHRSLPVQSLMRGCLLDDTGTVVEYLTPTNWRAHDLSGAKGQVMVEIPDHYRKFVTDGTKRRAFISELPLYGYHFVPKSYVSAYEATIENSTSKLCSIVNLGADYRGGDNQSSWDNTYRSQLGRPVSKKRMSTFRRAARARGAGSQWNCLDYNSYKAIFWLYYIEYANRNCQTPFNAAKDANGCSQGGLGNGVTTFSTPIWNEHYKYGPFIPCGHTDRLGNASGEVAYTMRDANNSNIATVYVNRYRGIENPFGHLWKWIDGVCLSMSTDSEGGTTMIGVANDPELYGDTNQYVLHGNIARTSGYVRELVFGEFGDIVPSIVGGGSTTYWGDDYYTDTTMSMQHDIVSGGCANDSSSAGFSCIHQDFPPKPYYQDKSIGSRLCFIPKQ